MTAAKAFPKALNSKTSSWELSNLWKDLKRMLYERVLYARVLNERVLYERMLYECVLYERVILSRSFTRVI